MEVSEMEITLSKRNGKGNGATRKSFVKGEQYIILKGLLAFGYFWKSVLR